MDFTYKGYGNLLSELRDNGYETASYFDWKKKSRCVILRHDIDYDIGKAVEMARFECERKVKSVYFVLLTPDFYNVFSKESAGQLRQILKYGHTVGLHFDESRYPEMAGDIDALRYKIAEEAKLLGTAAGIDITAVSMHRPGRAVLDADIQIPGIVNSYSTEFFKRFKYLSDSRRRWREPADRIIAEGEYDRLHILTHAFWYHEEELDIHDSVLKFVNDGNRRRYCWMRDNITDMESVLDESEVI